jgi:hypothetical protein
MNKISTDIYNKTKQSSQCCKYCGKNYLKKINLDRHVILCELLNTSKSSATVDEEDEVPSQRKMYQMILEIGKKLNGLDEKVDELNKWVVKKKKKINVIEWLNNHITPEIKFDNLIEKIILNKNDIQYLFQNTFADTINHIFSRNIYNVSESEYPIFAFVQKQNVFYIYENEETGWMELNREILVKFLNRVHTKLYRLYVEWKKENRSQIEDDEKLSLLCDKTTCKMMDVDFRQEAILGKIRSNMYGRMKTDMKALVEYDFEF